ncbi:hypothetical protein [Seonamhaeicola maritimus]|uniref:DUF4258 domain-containing protein n=1 Tax=Seonamhaeicola maritimus TaxID=2591822 RepID=A0A5C7GPB8_9FLAO|nr:hypothetical protein [Seonamhaeicola maritimus]TXG39761.1 hypothetical protein FUA22_07805 [Seonamhaeicola maritimus]
MKFIQRLGYYLGGFSIGLIVLAFFLNGKKVSCDYGPEARVLKNINSKQLNYTSSHIADSTLINHVLKFGKVNFSESNTRKEPCGTYNIEGLYNADNVILTIENCDSIATIKKVKIEK